MRFSSTRCAGAAAASYLYAYSHRRHSAAGLADKAYNKSEHTALSVIKFEPLGAFKVVASIVAFVANYRHLLCSYAVSALPYNLAFQCKNHIRRSLEIACILFPANATFTMIEAIKLLFHFLPAFFTDTFSIWHCDHHLKPAICTLTQFNYTYRTKQQFAKPISDASWGEFVRQLEYKTQWQHKTLVKIDPFFPSSQTCHVCGNKNSETRDLSVREWVCYECGAEYDRDINAAKNILNEGLRLLA